MRRRGRSPLPSARCPTTSANRSGEADARDAAEIADRLGDALALVLDGGAIRGGPASTVVDCTLEWPSILREGAIPSAEIAAALEAAGLAHAIGVWSVDDLE